MSAKINVTLKESKINAKTSIVNYYKGDKGDKGEKGDKGDNGKDGVGAEELQRINNEIVSARKDIFGKEYNNLAERLDSDSNKALVEGLKASFLKKKGKGSITAKNTLEGSIRNLKILGNTTGGYDSETSTSSALSSCGESENGIKVKTCGVNTFIVNSISLNAGNTEYHISGEYKVKLKGQISINNFSDKVAFVNINTIGGGYKKPLPLNKGKTLYTLQVDEEIVTYPYARKQDGWDDTNKNDLNKIMFSLGDISTDYEAYQESVVQVQLPSSMGSAKDVPNGSKDIVELSNTNVIQKCSSIILNDLNCTRISTTGTNVNVAYFDNVATDKAYSGLSAGNQKNIKADNKNFGLDFNVWDDATKINSVANAANGFWIFLNKSITDKSYFKENPTTIVYELKTHIIHELPNVGSLSTFRALTTLTVETEVEAGLEAEFPVDTNGTLTRLDRENEELEKENYELKSNQSFLAQTLYNILEVQYMPSMGGDVAKELEKLKQIIGGGIDVTTDNE